MTQDFSAFPFISVIIPAKSWTQDCDQCLASIKDQDYVRDRFEIIFVLDPPQKYNEQIQRNISNFDPCVRVLFSNGPGISAAKNLGILASRGKHVAFTDDDARPRADWLTKLMQCENRTKAAVVGGLVITDFDRLLPPILHANTNMGQQPLRAIGANVMYSKSILSIVGGFDEEFRRQEDHDLMLRIVSQNQKVVFCDDAVVYHKLDRFGLAGLWSLSKGGQYLPLMFKRHPDWTRKWLKMKGRLSLSTLVLVSFLASIALSFLILVTIKSNYALVLPVIAFATYSIGYARTCIPVGQKRPIAMLLLASAANLVFAAFILARTIYGSVRYRTLLL